MSMTDPIADMLTRIRNASAAYKKEVSMPSSKMKLRIARILKEEGFIEDYSFKEDNKQGILTIYLKYAEDKTPAIYHIERVSKPGRRVYVGKDSIPRVLRGIGIAILSTPRGVISDRTARKEGVGGEVICYVW